MHPYWITQPPCFVLFLFLFLFLVLGGFFFQDYTQDNQYLVGDILGVNILFRDHPGILTDNLRNYESVLKRESWGRQKRWEREKRDLYNEIQICIAMRILYHVIFICKLIQTRSISWLKVPWLLPISSAISVYHLTALANSLRQWEQTLSMSLQWRHNSRVGVSNHQPHDC